MGQCGHENGAANIAHFLIGNYRRRGTVGSMYWARSQFAIISKDFILSPCLTGRFWPKLVFVVIVWS